MVFWDYREAFLCEAVRGGINAVPPGQIEVARSLGFTFTGLLAQVVVLLKDTTLGYVVSYSELQYSAKVLVSSTGNLIQTNLVATVVYILVNPAILKVADAWGSRTQRNYATAGARVPTTTTMGRALLAGGAPLSALSARAGGASRPDN